MGNKIIQNLFFFSLLFIALSFPFDSKLSTIPLIIATICWFLEGNFKAKWQKLKSQPLAMLYASFFIITLLSLSYTEHIDKGLFDLGSVSPILIFPVILSTTSNKVIFRRYKYIFTALLAGCFISLIADLVNALHSYSVLHDMAVFYYTIFSFLMHPGFLSMYVNLCIIILLCNLLKGGDILLIPFKNAKVIQVFLLAVFCFYIMLLSSKTGTICLFLIITVFLALFIKDRTYKVWLKIISLTLYIGLILFFSRSNVSNRIGNAATAVSHEAVVTADDSKNEESTALRIASLKASFELIKENLLVGVGTGDVEPELIKLYYRDNMMGAYRHRLSCHNQYLKITVQSGIIGFVILVSLLLIPLYKAVKENKVLIVSFLAMIILYCLTDDVLVMQSGLVFYAFFNSFLTFIYPKLEK